MKFSFKFIWLNYLNDLFFNERGENFVCWFYFDFVVFVFWGGGGCDCVIIFFLGGGFIIWILLLFLCL